MAEGSTSNAKRTIIDIDADEGNTRVAQAGGDGMRDDKNAIVSRLTREVSVLKRKLDFQEVDDGVTDAKGNDGNGGVTARSGKRKRADTNEKTIAGGDPNNPSTSLAKNNNNKRQRLLIELSDTDDNSTIHRKIGRALASKGFDHISSSPGFGSPTPNHNGEQNDCKSDAIVISSDDNDDEDPNANSKGKGKGKNRRKDKGKGKFKAPNLATSKKSKKKKIKGKEKAAPVFDKLTKNQRRKARRAAALAAEGTVPAAGVGSNEATIPTPGWPNMPSTSASALKSTSTSREQKPKLTSLLGKIESKPRREEILDDDEDDEGEGKLLITVKNEEDDTDEPFYLRIKKEEDVDGLPQAINGYNRDRRDGGGGVFDLGGLGIGEDFEIEAEFKELVFHLEDILDEFGGSDPFQRFHNWDRLPSNNNKKKKPFCTFSPRFHFDLPPTPGKSGLLYLAPGEQRLDCLRSGERLDGVNCFFKKDRSEWYYGGIYKIVKTGEVSRDAFSKLPPAVRNLWSRVAGYEQWGKALITKRNRQSKEKLDQDGWADAEIDLNDATSIHRDGWGSGQLVMPLVVIKCVGFDKSIYNTLKRWGYPPNLSHVQRKAYVENTLRQEQERYRDQPLVREQQDQRHIRATSLGLRRERSIHEDNLTRAREELTAAEQRWELRNQNPYQYERIDGFGFGNGNGGNWDDGGEYDPRVAGPHYGFPARPPTGPNGYEYPWVRGNERYLTTEPF